MDPLKPGDKFGDRFTLLSKLGEGGFGEVWKARDKRLGRDVAIKVATRQFDWRFEREARTIAALNHPNICQIHDVGSNYIVMELIDGVQLSGPMPVEKAVAYAGQILDALDAAHRKKFTHRDLKPANVMVTNKSGTIKLLDFGLAKQEPVELGPDDETRANPNGLTQDQGLVGTLQYMSPEQLQAKQADARSDIFAFGCVLYEILSGKKAFSGSTTASVIAAIMEREPEPLQMAPPLDRVLRTCLAKDPDDRFQTARDVKKALLWAMETTAGAAPRRAQLPWAIVAGVLGFIAAGVSLVHFREKPVEARVVQTEINPPDKTSFSGDGWMALSPDGGKLVFGAATSDGKNQLWLRSLDSGHAQPIAGTDNGNTPFWSPDSKSIGFFNGSSLERVDAAGGPVQTLARAPGGYASASWAPDGTILFNPINGSSLLKISAKGGQATRVTGLAGGIDSIPRDPWFLPDGRHFLFWSGTTGVARGTIHVGSLESSDSPALTEADSGAVYACGRILFLRGTTLMAQPFDARTLKLSDEAVPVAEHVRSSPFYAAFSVSQGGDLVYIGGMWGGNQLTWFRRDGMREGTLGEPGQIFGPTFSPDRKRLSVGLADPASGNVDIWVYEIERGLRTRFTFDPAAERFSVWSPDGETIVFNSTRKGPGDLYRRKSNGSEAEELLYTDGRGKVPTSFSPDGKFLLYFANDPKTSNDDIWVLPDPLRAAGASKPYPWLHTSFNEQRAQFSPDGKWVMYQSDESGRTEIYVTTFPGPGGKRQISSGGGQYPRWRADGREIFYVNPTREMMATEFSAGKDGFGVGKTTGPLFGGMPNGPLGFRYDVTTDGKRFLAIIPAEQSNLAPLTLVQNWAAGLRK